MGIVAKQTLSNSAILFFGALLGAINVMLLYPMGLPDQEIGLTRILISFTVLFSQLAHRVVPFRHRPFHELVSFLLIFGFV